MRQDKNLEEIGVVMRWQRGRSLLSLADMIRFLAKDVFDSSERLNYWEKSIARRIIDLAPGSDERRNNTGKLIEAVQRLQRHAVELGLIETKGRCDHFASGLKLSMTNFPSSGSPMSVISADEASAELVGIESAFRREMAAKHFAFIPSDKAVFFEKDDLFGDNVSSAFPSAKEDIKDAGNCLAAGLNTAAVSHLMLAVNAALIVLGRHLKVKLKLIEQHDWKPIIDSVRTKLEKSHSQKRSPKKQREVEFYADILGELSALKDVHRNNVFHARKRYNEQEALGVYERVKSLMRRLAERLSE